MLLARGPVETLNVPHTCRSVQSRRDLLVGAIESSGIVLLHHSRRGVAEPERDEDGFAPASNIIVAPVWRRCPNGNPCRPAASSAGFHTSR